MGVGFIWVFGIFVGVMFLGFDGCIYCVFGLVWLGVGFLVVGLIFGLERGIVIFRKRVGLYFG